MASISCVQYKFNTTIKVIHQDSERNYKNHNDLEIYTDLFL